MSHRLRTGIAIAAIVAPSGALWYLEPAVFLAIGAMISFVGGVLYLALRDVP